MRKRVVIVSAFLPPHVGGVESLVGWMCEALPRAGWLVSTVGNVGDADLFWPCTSWKPFNQPIPHPSHRIVRSYRALARKSDVVLINNFFWPLSTIAASLAYRERIPALTMVHSNTTAPAGSSGPVRHASALHARTFGHRQLTIAPPVAGSYSAVEFIRRTFGIEAEVFPLPLPRLPPPDATLELKSEEPMRIVFAGRLVELKDPGSVIAAVGVLSRRRPVLLDVFGDGPLRATLESESPSWVRFHGSQPRAAVLAALVRAHCFVNASTTDNALLSVLEALCMGVPTVTTNVGDAAKYLEPDLARLLVPVGDSEALVDALAYVAEDWAAVRARAATRGAVLLRQHSTSEGLRGLDYILSEAASRARAH